jgi:ABC-type transport system substrate-binding protein
LIPHAGASSEPLELRFVKDESTRVLIALKGEVDLLPNAVGLSKARWLQKKKADHYSVLEPEGIAVSYLALNLTHPILSKKQVRRALQMAIPRNEILKNKFFGFGRPASSFLSPKLPEAWHTEIPYDPEQAEELLDQAGFPRKNGKSRFRLHYKTTPSREGQETALMLRDAWHKIGVEIDLEVVEASIFFASVRKGSFELYSARWVGVSDGSIFHRTLHSQGSDNRVRFHHPQMDVLLDRAAVELIPETRKVLYQEVQKLMIEEAPYSPLWFWDQAIFLSKELIAPPLPDWSLAGSFEAWKKLRWKEPPK